MVATHTDRRPGAPVPQGADRSHAATVADGARAADAAERSGSRTESAAVGAAVLAALAFVAAIFAVGLAARAVSEVRDSGSAGATADAPAASGDEAATVVGLADFSIEPAELEVDGAGVLTVRNDGAVEHNLVVDGIASDMIPPGETGELDLSGLEPGTYDMWCDVAGHQEAGMTGVITVE